MSDIDIDCHAKRRKINVALAKQNEQVLTDDDSSTDGNEEDDKEDQLFTNGLNRHISGGQPNPH